MLLWVDGGQYHSEGYDWPTQFLRGYLTPVYDAKFFFEFCFLWCHWINDLRVTPKSSANVFEDCERLPCFFSELANKMTKACWTNHLLTTSKSFRIFSYSVINLQFKTIAILEVDTWNTILKKFRKVSFLELLLNLKVFNFLWDKSYIFLTLFNTRLFWMLEVNTRTLQDTTSFSNVSQKQF